MTDIAEILVVQYRLTQTPSAAQVEQWASIAEQLISSGVEREQAGRQAAKEAFAELFST